MVQEAYIGVMHADRKYTESKGKRTTYYGWWIRSYVGCFLKEHNKNRGTVHIDAFISKEEPEMVAWIGSSELAKLTRSIAKSMSVDYTNQIDNCIAFDQVLDKVNDKTTKRFLKMYYTGMTCSEIAKVECNRKSAKIKSKQGVHLRLKNHVFDVFKEKL